MAFSHDRHAPAYFMGHKIMYDPVTMEYKVCDEHGNYITVELAKLENDSEYMASVVDVVNRWQRSNPGAITATQVARSKPDLSDVSTRDLLNEAFKRGAIKQIEMKRRVASEMASDKDYREHLHTSILHDALASASRELEKYGVFNLGKVERHDALSWEDVEYSVDYFICKHPLTIQKEG